MPNPSGVCPKCLRICQLTRHHIYPKVHFRGSREILFLCRECHDILEMYWYPKRNRKRLKKRDYLEIIERFLKNPYRRSR